MRARSRSRCQRGISLLDVMVALTIVGLLSTAVVVMMESRQSALDRFAGQLTRSLAEARQEALVSGQVIGFAAERDFSGWRYFRFRDGQWTAITDHPALERVTLARDITLEPLEGALVPREGLDTGRETASAAPQVWFDPTGFDSPFVYVLSTRDERRLVRRRDDGQLTLSDEDRAREFGAAP